ncbi:MAG TPA: bifunctional DNA-formamidopyrimidine glycosylase/DNA-(apurinic or apyrimidinic site) lyase [Planctomycetaceae bacterium]|nr:bifunctional DNA-formamidopyrimidine glycosylase/DNA-(apurinic or apyrimidinic site) lyase [Planctomycetaceae bacterium]
MPELPEVETMVRGIRPHVEGRRLAGLVRCRCRCRPIELSPPMSSISRRIKAARVESVRRLAKRVVLELSNGDAFVVEPRMTGLMLLSDPPDPEHLRLRWDFADAGRHASLWFWDRRGLGTVRLYSAEALKALVESRRLGPDALAMTRDVWRERLAATRRPVKVALLDQKLAAGIGNLYASEILHHARIHPARRSDRLTTSDVRRLHAAVQEVLTAAIRQEGSTLSDGTYRNALSESGRYQTEHRVYRKAGQRCPTCGRGNIRRIVQAQRSTFFCGRCQRTEGC